MATATATTGTSLSPGATAVTSLVRQILNYVQSPEDESRQTMAVDSINLAIRKLNMRLWQWSVQTQTITFAASDRDYTLNTDHKKPFKFLMRDTSSNWKGFLKFAEPKEFVDAFPDHTTEGEPSRYSILNNVDANELILNLPPSADWVSNTPDGVLYYYSRLPTVELGGSISEAPNEVEAFIIWRAREEMAALVGKADMVGIAQAEARECWRMLIADDNDTQSDF